MVEQPILVTALAARLVVDLSDGMREHVVEFGPLRLILLLILGHSQPRLGVISVSTLRTQ
jgi:hypothetical protein